MHEHDGQLGRFPTGTLTGVEGRVRGTPTTAGATLLRHGVVEQHATVREPVPPSDRRFTINVNAQAQRLTVATTGLPDANIGQAYTAPALTAVNGNVSSWSIAGGALPAV